MTAAEPALVAVDAADPGFFWTVTRRSWDEGKAVLPLPPGPAELRRAIVATLRPVAVVDADGSHPAPAPGPPASAGTAVVMLTSGTTGSARAAELSHRALEAAARAVHGGLDLTPGDRWLCVLPVHHVAGLMTLVRSLHAGCEPLFGSPDSLVRGAGGGAAVSLVPTLLTRVLAAGADLARWKAILVGGGPVPRPLVAAARARGAHVVTSYGMTEMCGGFVLDGVPVEGARVRVAADGEVLAAGPMMLTEYRLDPATTASRVRSGWFHTGDMGSVDHTGRLQILGRRDDAVVTGGEKVAPAEVERVLAAHPGIEEAVVVGRPDEEWGEVVVAFVIPDETRRPTAAEVRDFVASAAPRYWVPKEVHYVDALPRLPSGKPDRRALRDLAADASRSL